MGTATSSAPSALTWIDVWAAAAPAFCRNQFQLSPGFRFQFVVGEQLALDLVILQQIHSMGTDNLKNFFNGLHHAIGDSSGVPLSRRNWLPEFTEVMQQFRLILESEARSPPIERFQALLPCFRLDEFDEPPDIVGKRIASDFHPANTRRYWFLPDAGDFALEKLREDGSRKNIGVFVAYLEYAVAQLNEIFFRLAEDFQDGGGDENETCQDVLEKCPLENCGNMTIEGGVAGRYNYLRQYVRAQFRNTYLGQIKSWWQADFDSTLVTMVGVHKCDHYKEIHEMVEAIRKQVVETPTGLRFKAVEYFLGHYSKHRELTHKDTGRSYENMEKYLRACNQVVAHWEQAGVLSQSQKSCQQLQLQGRRFEYFKKIQSLKHKSVAAIKPEEEDCEAFQKYKTVVGECNVHPAGEGCHVFLLTCHDVKRTNALKVQE